MSTYNVTDGRADIKIEADSPREACEEYVAGGEWGNTAKTTWVSVTATEIVAPLYDATGIGGYTTLTDLLSLPGAPDVDSSALSEGDRTILCDYLRTDDGSVSTETQECHDEIADEIEALDAPESDSETHTIEIAPTKPDCADGESHDWQSPYCVVGGLRENPGVSGHGGGVICTEVCRHCGCYQVTDTWAQNSATGEQGLRSVEYCDADESSEAWVNDEKENAERGE